MPRKNEYATLCFCRLDLKYYFQRTAFVQVYFLNEIQFIVIKIMWSYIKVLKKLAIDIIEQDFDQK